MQSSGGFATLALSVKDQEYNKLARGQASGSSKTPALGVLTDRNSS